ncbi:hypothetical protein [Bacteroides sp.]|uniref:hypothetical protein n=1 Tax=Bacteroides sp. TaxID=29523 RepID=UPI00260FE6C7|nr:hypothetical protein [Bacteroides sp.]MDD3040003.1 hypothetical protein [Bacteroides sp.]
MKHIFIFTVAALLAISNALFVSAQGKITELQNLPITIKSGPYKAGHIQGIAVDAERKYIYLSYTTMLIKADLNGNVIGSVKGLLGHLGCLDFNEKDGRVYGSLEYKDDGIGKGILQMEKSLRKLDNAFYIAIFDVERITRMDMDAEKDGIMSTVYLPTVLDDYLATVTTVEGEKPHRFGCSGIDGVSFGPRFGKKDGKEYLTVAYGIYGEVERSDNDYQVLLQYDISKWGKYETSLSQENMHTNGPAQPDREYFAMTGNTTYGVQNLEYDAYTKSWFMCVYSGKKKHFPNYSLYAIDGAARPVKQPLKGVPYIKKGFVVPLKAAGLKDDSTSIHGWNFNIGATGFCSLGEGYFYISHNYRTAEGQGSNIRLYRYTGEVQNPFKLVE